MKWILKLAGLIYLVLSIVYRVYMFRGLEYSLSIQNIMTFGLNHILGVLVALGIAIILVVEHKPSLFMILLVSSVLGIFQNVIDILQNLDFSEPIMTIDLILIFTPFAFHGITLLGVMMVYTKAGKALIIWMQSMLILFYGYYLYAVYYISPFDTAFMQKFFVIYTITHMVYGLLMISTVLYWFRQNKDDLLPA